MIIVTFPTIFSLVRLLFSITGLFCDPLIKVSCCFHVLSPVSSLFNHISSVEKNRTVNNSWIVISTLYLHCNLSIISETWKQIQTGEGQYFFSALLFFFLSLNEAEGKLCHRHWSLSNANSMYKERTGHSVWTHDFISSSGGRPKPKACILNSLKPLFRNQITWHELFICWGDGWPEESVCKWNWDGVSSTQHSKESFYKTSNIKSASEILQWFYWTIPF